MRILIAVPHFPPRHLAGAELKALEEAVWLLGKGHQVQVVCVDSVDDRRVSGLDVREDLVEGVPVKRLAYDLDALGSTAATAYAHPLLERFFEDLLSEGTFDLLHVMSGYLIGLDSIRAAHRMGVPVIVSPTDYWFICPTLQLLKGDGSLCSGPEPLECARCLAHQKRRYRLLDEKVPWLVRWFFRLRARWLPGRAGLLAELAVLEQRQADMVGALNSVKALVTSGLNQRELLVLNGVRAEQFTMIDAFDVCADSSGPPLPRPRISGSPFCIGYLGQLTPVKGVDVLIRAFRRLRPQGVGLRLSIVGDLDSFPSYVAQLRKLARGDQRIEFLGRYERTRIPALMQQADVLVVPSMWREGTARVVIEAFWHGVPVVASRLGELPHLVRDEVDGLLFERGNVADLARQLQRLIDDPRLYERIQKEVRPLRSSENGLVELLAAFERAVGQESVRHADTGT